MKLRDALDIVYEVPKESFRVSFDWKRNGMLCGDHFPERDEKPFDTQLMAWSMASEFADKMKGKVVNVYVINADDWTPVKDYRRKMLNENK